MIWKYLYSGEKKGNNHGSSSESSVFWISKWKRIHHDRLHRAVLGGAEPRHCVEAGADPAKSGRVGGVVLSVMVGIYGADCAAAGI